MPIVLSEKRKKFVLFSLNHDQAPLSFSTPLSEGLSQGTHSLEVFFKSVAIFRRYDVEVVNTISASVTFASLNMACI